MFTTKIYYIKNKVLEGENIVNKIFTNKKLLIALAIIVYIALMFKIPNIMAKLNLIGGVLFLGYLFAKSKKFKKIKKRGKVLSILGVFTFMLFFGAMPLTSSNTKSNTNVSKDLSIFSKDNNVKEDDKKANEIKENVIKIKEDKNLDEIKVSFIDVGQADSILIQQGNNSMLIDGGNNEDGNLVKEYISKQGIENLDVVIGTHPHEDHIGGLSYVMNSFKVGKVYLPQKMATTKTYENLITTIKNKNISTIKAKIGEQFYIGKAKCTILAPRKQYDKVNDNSIVLKLEFGEKTFLFTGDAEATSEMDMVKSGSLNTVDLLKVGHHGSKTSSCINFLNTITPKYAVISVGKDNKYGHPNEGTIRRLKQVHSEVYRTDKSGTIVVTSDGKNITFNVNSISYDELDKEKEKEIFKDNKNANNNSKVNHVKQSNSNLASVWITETGKKYHSTNHCGKTNSSKATQITLSEAKNRGIKPCDKCHAPI